MTEVGHLETRLQVLRPLLGDEATIEIAINADGRVWVERAGDSHMSLAGIILPPVEVRDLAGLIANKQRLTLTDNQPAISTTVSTRPSTATFPSRSAATAPSTCAATSVSS